MSTENPTVKEIVVDYLKENGYDGLVHDGGCGCAIDEIGNCEGLSENCQAAWKQKTHCPDCDAQCGGINGDGETYCYTTDKKKRIK